MNFLFPNFLLALVFIAIPLVIHLFNFKKFKKVKFSNTSFLREIQLQTSSRQKIKQRLILLFRILAIIFFVLAFSKPYFSKDDETTSSLNNVVSIYLDNSYSMEAVNKEGTLLEEGKRKATEIANTYGLNDKFQLLNNNVSGFQSKLLNKDELIDALAKVKISQHPVNYQQVINAQARYLNHVH